MNVLLVSSDHMEPHRLREFDFKIQDVTLIFAGEVPPQRMLSQLKEVGVGDNLAGVLVGTYGGHVWTLYRAMSAMAANSNFKPLQALRSDVSSVVATCVRLEKEKHLGMEGMRAMLHELAKVGFVPIAEDSRPEERRVGKEGVRTCRSRWSTQ